MTVHVEHPPASGLEKGTKSTLNQTSPPGPPWYSPIGLWQRKTTIIAALSIVGIALHLALRFGFLATPGIYQLPLLATLVIGGLPLLYDLLRKLLKREFGSDLLGGIAIITSVLLGEYLAGAIIVLMLAGGEALERYALRSASSVLAALAKRMPLAAHRQSESDIVDVELLDVAAGDILVMYPNDICPVDGVVIAGHGVMDESYLTGEPFQITKTSGSNVISGAINGESAFTIRTTKVAADSRYAKIMEVMRESEAKRPTLRRLGDQLGAVYTPVAMTVAVIAWAVSGESVRFLAVLVIATPCSLLIAIPVAIIGSISLCARRAIIVKNPVALEQIAACRTAIFDKTGTLTYGEPTLTEQLVAPGFVQADVLILAASLERYSKHPLARAILTAAPATGIPLPEATKVSEMPGHGLRGNISGHQVLITSRSNSRRNHLRASISFRRFASDAMVAGERYLVSMLGASVGWVRNVQAVGGNVRFHHGRHEAVHLEEAAGDRRAPVLKAYLQRAPGVRAHLPIDKDAPLAAFAQVASQCAVFRVVVRNMA